MKIAWFCIPAHGHTNPTLGIVRELTAAGHKVYYFSFEMFREKIEQAGAVLISCDGYDFEMEDKGNADRVGKDGCLMSPQLRPLHLTVFPQSI